MLILAEQSARQQEQILYVLDPLTKNTWMPLGTFTSAIQSEDDEILWEDKGGYVIAHLLLVSNLVNYFFNLFTYMLSKSDYVLGMGQPPRAGSLPSYVASRSASLGTNRSFHPQSRSATPGSIHSTSQSPTDDRLRILEMCEISPTSLYLSNKAGNDVRFIYGRYQAIRSAITIWETKKRDRTWLDAPSSKVAIISVFTSTSNYYESATTFDHLHTLHNDGFLQAGDMLSWLGNEPECKPNLAVWGSGTQSLKTLKDMVLKFQALHLGAKSGKKSHKKKV